MVSFARKRKYETRESVLRVDGDLEPGTYRFRLQVSDESGNLSKPAELKVEIVRGVPGRPITRLTDGDSRLIRDGVTGRIDRSAEDD
jgi:hypothetical protein